MSQSGSNKRNTDWILWSALPAYFIIWLIFPIIMAGPQFWYLGSSLGVIYVAMHCYEMKYRGHCGLSSDATAVPVTLVAAGLLFFVSHRTDIGIDASHIGDGLIWMPLAFITGHIAAFLVVMTLSALFEDQ
ncbi:hypothetical protein [Corallincola spongiicola]|uniref:Uncharacterized protein n=1 Tax=Corallincola spongiicola TaxID=2520508 RepID=A0ABY1WS97_9GAMM|nr:hypothetical protein [Corallincola spongiicola]TAA47458.1 hypothetical protein EXY25_09555 [Corallincola spongiicola]